MIPRIGMRRSVMRGPFPGPKTVPESLKLAFMEVRPNSPAIGSNMMR